MSRFYTAQMQSLSRHIQARLGICNSHVFFFGHDTAHFVISSRHFGIPVSIAVTIITVVCTFEGNMLPDLPSRFQIGSHSDSIISHSVPLPEMHHFLTTDLFKAVVLFCYMVLW